MFLFDGLAGWLFVGVRVGFGEEVMGRDGGRGSYPAV